MTLWKKIKLILSSVRQYKKYALITPLFMVGEALLECLMPFTMSILVDSIKQNASLIVNDGFQAIFETINYSNPELHIEGMPVSFFGVVIALLLMAFASLGFGILGGIYGAKASVGLATNLRSDLYKKIQSFSFQNIDKFSSSSLITRMTTDVNQIQQAFQMLIRIVVRAPLMMVFSAILAFITGGPIAFVFVALVPLVCIGLLLIGKSAMKIFIRVFKRYDKLNESVQENVSGIRVVKSYVREDFEKEKFSNASNSVRNDFVKAEKIIALNNPLLNTIIHLSNILVVGIGSYVIFSSKEMSLTVGQMSAMLTYGIQILTNVLMISMVLVMMFMSLESVRRIGEVLVEQSSIVNPDNPIKEINSGDIVFENVNFKYKESADQYALKDININIKSGQFIGILGSTGSGKTSLVNLISRLYDVTDGRVLVAGNDVKNYDLETLRNSVSVVLQKNVLFSGTITSNLKWGDANATKEEMMRAIEIAQANDIVNAKAEGLMSKVEQGGANFSGGQKQRLCIARAILRKPKIMILDDSTSAVDTKTDRLIRKGLKEDLPEMTKIVIAQRISSIEDADQIIVMDNGSISAIGTHDELMNSSKIYQEVYNTQNRVGGNE